MFVFGKSFAVAIGAVALSGAALAPLGFALAAGSAEAHQISQPVQVASAPINLPAAVQPVEAIMNTTPTTIDPSADDEDAVTRDAPAPSPPAIRSVDAELTCLAKVVVHEAGNQSRAGQMAVAQVVMNRVNDSRGRFGRTICGVIMQRGQFFNVHAYNPPRNARWRTAVEIARLARDGDHPPVIGNALFFHAAYAAPFRGRTRVGRIGDHVFYR